MNAKRAGLHSKKGALLCCLVIITAVIMTYFLASTQPETGQRSIMSWNKFVKGTLQKNVDPFRWRNINKIVREWDKDTMDIANKSGGNTKTSHSSQIEENVINTKESVNKIDGTTKNQTKSYDPFIFPKFNPEEPCIPQPQTCDVNKPVVPNIVHIIWFYEHVTEFPFYQLISVLSAARIQKADQIWFWYNRTLPVGRYWEELNEEMNKSSVKFLLKPTAEPTEIHGIEIKIPEHKSDVMRLYVMSKFGGIYLDSDMLILRNLQPLMCYNHTQGRQNSGTLANGFMMAAPGTEFVKLWHDSYTTFDPNSWGGHSTAKPYRLWLNYPDKIHVENLCLIRPNDGESRSIMFQNDSYFDWSQNYGIHIYMTFYRKRVINAETIKVENNTASHIFHYIYYGKLRKGTSKSYPNIVQQV